MKNQTFFGLVAIVGILGVYVGYVTVDRYETIVRATLGFTVLYLLYREYFLSKGVANKRIDIRTDFTSALRYLVIDFFATIIGFWASVQVVHLIRDLGEIFVTR